MLCLPDLSIHLPELRLDYSPDQERGPDGKWSSVGGTKPVPKVIATEGKLKGKLRPDGSPGDQLPKKLRKQLEDLGVRTFPAAHIGKIEVSKHLGTDKQHDGGLIRWRDDKGNLQTAYSAKHDEKQAVEKFARVLKNAPKMDAAVKGLEAKGKTDAAAAATLLIAHTGLRVGDPVRDLDTKHYGVTSMQARHVRFEGETAHIEFEGKHGKENSRVIDDPKMVEILKEHIKGKEKNDPVFFTSLHMTRKAAPEGVKLKDFRTLKATRLAEKTLAGITPKMNGTPKENAREILGHLKTVSETVANYLNNTPGVAREHYIAPQVIHAWGAKHNVPKEWTTWP